MSRVYYADYANHCLRFYVKYPNPKFKRNVDKENWKACDEVFMEMNDADKILITEVFSINSPLGDSVKLVAKKLNLSANDIWKTIKDVERKIAISRALI